MVSCLKTDFNYTTDDTYNAVAPFAVTKFLPVVTTLSPAAGAPPLVYGGDCPQLVPELLVPTVEFALLCLAFCFIPQGLANSEPFFFAAKNCPSLSAVQKMADRHPPLVVYLILPLLLCALECLCEFSMRQGRMDDACWSSPWTCPVYEHHK